MYAIRTTPANSEDQVLCSKLGFTSCHSLMSGYTDFSVGMVRGEPAMIPIETMIEAGSNKVSRRDNEWQRLIASTGQRNLLSPANYEEVLKLEHQEALLIEGRYQEIKKKIYGHEDPKLKINKMVSSTRVTQDI